MVVVSFKKAFFKKPEKVSVTTGGFMKKGLIICIIILLSIAEGMALSLGGKDLIKYGIGSRTKMFIGSVYLASLYIPQELKGKDGTAILEAEQPMSIVIQIDSSIITNHMFIKAVKEGFENSAKSGYTSDKKEEFLKSFDGLKFHKGDIFYLNYTPKEGVTVNYTSKKTGETQKMVTTPGLDLKKALYAIWLGPHPAQENLKKAMLGNQ